MKYDFSKTLALTKGGLLDHQTTWKSYLEDSPGWQQTAMVLTGPLILANVLLSLVFSRLIGGFAYYDYYGGFLSALFWGLIMACLGIVIAVYTFDFLAGIFKGKRNFSRAFAAVSLAAIPAWTAGIVGAVVPYIGFLITLAGGIMSLVFLYKIMPLALDVPDEKRVVHFIASLLAIIVLNFIAGSILGVGAIGNSSQRDIFSNTSTSSRSTTGSGVLGEFERQGQLMEAAEADVYDPPTDGKLTEAQVEAYVKVLKKTRALHQDFAKKAQKFSDKMEAKNDAGETPSAADLSQLYSGIGSALSANNAEMEVVKTGNGNWAEHLWIKQQLRIAQIQQGDGNEAISHNFKLYKKYQEDLDNP